MPFGGSAQIKDFVTSFVEGGGCYLSKFLEQDANDYFDQADWKFIEYLSSGSGPMRIVSMPYGKECTSFHEAHLCTSCHDKRSSSTCKCSSTCTFLRCLEKKTDRQIVLNGALHLSDYVTKVMKRLSHQGVFPKVVLESVL